MTDFRPPDFSPPEPTWFDRWLDKAFGALLACAIGSGLALMVLAATHKWWM